VVIIHTLIHTTYIYRERERNCGRGRSIVDKILKFSGEFSVSLREREREREREYPLIHLLLVIKR